MLAFGGFIIRIGDNHPKQFGFHSLCYIVARTGVCKADADPILAAPSLTSQPQET